MPISRLHVAYVHSLAIVGCQDYHLSEVQHICDAVTNY